MAGVLAVSLAPGLALADDAKSSDTAQLETIKVQAEPLLAARLAAGEPLDGLAQSLAADATLEPELRRVGIEYNQYIRDKVLPPSKRPVFDQLARGPLG